MLLQLAGELQQRKQNSILLLEGPGAARLEFATTLAERLNSQLHHAGIGHTAASERTTGVHPFFLMKQTAYSGKRSSVQDAHDRYANGSTRFRMLILGVANGDALPPHIGVRYELRQWNLGAVTVG